MGMQPVNNPYGGVNPLIDKMIGNAYDIVKYVARYLEEIRYVAENMKTVWLAANGNTLELTATAASDTLSVALPDDFDPTQLRGISVIAVTGDGQIYPMDPTTFFAYVTPDNTVDITLADDGPTGLDTAEYRINLRLANP